MEDEVGGEIITTETGCPLGFDPQLALPRILLNIGGPGSFWETQYTCSEVLNLLLTKPASAKELETLLRGSDAIGSWLRQAQQWNSRKSSHLMQHPSISFVCRKFLSHSKYEGGG